MTTSPLACRAWLRSPCPSATCCPDGGRSQRVAFHYQVARPVHTQLEVRLLRPLVLLLDVEPQADHLRVLLRQRGDVFVQRPEDAAAAGLRPDVDALDPPEPAVAPVAEL